MFNILSFKKLKKNWEKPFFGLVALDGARILWKILGFGKFILLLLGIGIGIAIGMGRKT